MRASPDDIRRLEGLALARGGTISQPVQLPSRDVAAVAASISEADFSMEFRKLWKRNGWNGVHFRPARIMCPVCCGKSCDYCTNGYQWRTAVEGEGGKGFPDWLLWRERVVWAELKAEGGKMSLEQLERAAELERAGQEVYCFYPSEWAKIETVLR